MSWWLLAALANHVWQSTVFIIAVWIATRALHGNAARVRSWLWTAASIKFLLPLSALVNIGERFQWRTAPPVVQPAVSFVMEDVLTPVNVSALVPAIVPQPATPMWPWLLLAIWGAGAAVVIAIWWRQWTPIRTALRGATRLILGDECGAAGLAILSSPSIPEPGVVGIFRPVLLFPEGLVERLTVAQLRAVIAHERCHVRRRDNLVAAMHMAVEAIYWFHPAVWWIESRLVDERERACDEAVLQSGSQPADYATAILEVCRQAVDAAIPCVAGVSGSNLRLRVEAIMRNEIGKPMTRVRRWGLACGIVAAIGGPVIAGALTPQAQVVVPAAGIRFEAAAIKPLPPPGGIGIGPIELAIEAGALKAEISRPRAGQSFKAGGPLNALIQAAYTVKGGQIAGGPLWATSERFAIDARAAGDLSPERMQGLLRSVLAERFALVLHREVRTLPVYELVVADGGLKIAALKDGDCIQRSDVRWDQIDLNAPLYVCGQLGRRRLSQLPETRPFPRWPRVDRLVGGGISMAALIDGISGDVDRLVIDKTGFTAPFNLVLDFARLPGAAPNASTADGPAIFAALEVQLGLRLVPADASVEMLVIDRAERPATNP